MEQYFKTAIEEARNGIKNKEGGPFGAVIVKDGQIVGVGHNKVLINNDPTAHAEVTAIRDACQKLNTNDLTGCVLYTTTEPCPMCLSATVWANIKDIYYGTDRKDAAKIGFRDDAIYQYLEGTNKELINKKQIKNKECNDLLDDYKGEMY